MYKFIIPALFIFLIACEKSPQPVTPKPQTLTREASGYYCLMTVLYHRGPKGQIILDDKPEALWFTSVRDTIAFTLSPEEPRNIAAIYVNDMTDANWDNPGEDNWIDANKAWYVTGSKLMGGMGMPEAVPFSSKEQAELYAKEQGGNVYDLASIPKEYIQNAE